MIRNRRALLLAGFAVLALNAIGASTASANFTTEHTDAAAFTNVEGGNTVLTTEPDGTGTTAHHVFDIPGNGSITCSSADFEGTVSNGPTLTSVPLNGRGATPFTGCFFLGQPASVELNGCGFEAKAPSTLAIVGCSAGKEITFSAGGCTVHAPTQDLPESHIEARNLGTSGSGMYITMQLQATKIRTTATGAGCISTGETTNGTYTTGNMLIKGHVDSTGAQKAITVH